MTKVLNFILNSIKSVKKASKLPNADDFDGDFREVLRLFHLSGFQQNSKLRQSCVCFSFILLTTLFGAVKDTAITLFGGDILNAMVNTAMLMILLTHSSQVWNFASCQSEAIKLIKDIQKLHGPADEDQMNKYRKVMYLMIKIFTRTIYVFVVTMLPTLEIFGLTVAKLAFPVIYDIFAIGKLYWVFAVINFVHLWFLTFTFVASEFLHILFIVRIEANLKFLATRLRNCADFADQKENEKALINCVKYHCEILE